jgi:hypothetical protein
VKIVDGIHEKYNSKTGKLEKAKAITPIVWNHYCERCGKHIDYITAHRRSGWVILCLECANELYELEGGDVEWVGIE